MIEDPYVIASSFRDPNGVVFVREGSVYRQVNNAYREDYDHLMTSGLYTALVKQELLIPHEEVDVNNAIAEDAYKILKPTPIPFISYPYEWCFSQLKDAALMTLKIQKLSLEHGMTLKDSSAFNIQFLNGKPIFIDTISFEKYREGQTWDAYKQFCQHFLAPLALMHYRSVHLNKLFQVYIDGIPLDLASSLLPLRAWARFTLWMHIFIHAKSQQRYGDKPVKMGKRKMNRFSFLGLIDSLETAIKKLKWNPKGTEWSDYYTDTNYSKNALEHKKQLVEKFLTESQPNSVWDLGANTGLFSRLASARKIQTVAFDIDPAAVEKNYRQCRKEKEAFILPLLLDLTNPSANIGWHSQERVSFVDRGPVDLALALALIHHLAIANNIPLGRIAKFFSHISKWLIIEFIPKDDTQVNRLIQVRKDIFNTYTQESFEREFKLYFDILHIEDIKDTRRVLYLMKVRSFDR